MKTKEVIEKLQKRFPNEPEYIQAVEQVLITIEDEYNKHPEFDKCNLIERLCIPDRIYSFRVTWIDDNGKVQNNMGYRIQFNNAIGPYKGGIRFNKNVNLSILKFLGFEQTFKNALTTLPMGGAKGGSDFDPHGKSDGEIMRFCQAFITEMYRFIGENEDVPAGDLGVGGREVGYMFGMYKKLTHQFTGSFTGKGLEMGGSLMRPEATGYGNVYFMENMLRNHGDSLEGKSAIVSGAGNVAQYTVEKLLLEDVKVLTMSDTSGVLYIASGYTRPILEEIKDWKTTQHKSLKEYYEKNEKENPKRIYDWTFNDDVKFAWTIKADLALPSATQNEIDGEDAKKLIDNGVIAVSEGANMPSTPEAVKVFQQAKILYAPGKASNAGGVAVSGLEMSQDSIRLNWTKEEVDIKLQSIMRDIHDNCVKYGVQQDGYVDYVKGANVVGFLKVSKAMMMQGVI